MAAGELGNFPRGAPHATSDVENLHVFLNPDGGREVVFVSDDALGKGFAEGRAVEVEALAKAELIKVGSEVVIPR